MDFKDLVGGGAPIATVNLSSPTVQVHGVGAPTNLVPGQPQVIVTPQLEPLQKAFEITSYEKLHSPTSVPMQGGGEQVIKAMMFLFSPKANYAHMVRPHMYNFNDFNALEIMRNAFNNNNEMVTRNLTTACPAILESIMPANSGHVVNLSALSQSWTFMLVVETMGVASMVSYMSTPIFKNIAVGYCIDEPLGVNGSVNPRCILKFTHHQRFQARKASNQNALSTMIPKQSHDVIPSQYQGLSVDPLTGMASLVKMTPHSIRSVPSMAMAQHQLMGSRAPLFDNMALPSLSPGESAQVSSDVKLTPVHLRVLTDTLKDAGGVVNENTIYNGYTEHQRMRGDDLSSTFYNILWSKDLLVNQGIGTWDERYFMTVIQEIPQLEVHPLNIETPRNWDVYDSRATNTRNQFHSWLGDTISQACEATGITEISFDYTTVGPVTSIDRKGIWRLTEGLLQTIFGNNVALVQKAFFELQGLLENDLFFILKQTIGDFTLSVNFTAYSAAVINLVMHDFNDNLKGVYYEHPIQFGGLINPQVGSPKQYTDNCLELQNFVNMMSM